MVKAKSFCNSFKVFSNKWKRYCRSLFFLFLLSDPTYVKCSQEVPQSPAKISLKDIPEPDQAFLNQQFKSLFNSDFGYTLIGEKPMSLEWPPDCELSFGKDCLGKRAKLYKYLKAIFSSSNKYIFLCPDPELDNFEMVLINKASFIKTACKEKKLLHRIFKKDTSLDKLISLLTDRMEATNSNFNFDETTLFGIFLGSGKSNIPYFKRRITLGYALNKPPLVWLVPRVPNIYKIVFYSDDIHQLQVYPPFKKGLPEKNPHFSTLEEEWEWIKEARYKIPKTLPPQLVHFPCFICKKSPETNTLMKKYEQAAEKLGQLFAKHNYLEAVINYVNCDE